MPDRGDLTRLKTKNARNGDEGAGKMMGVTGRQIATSAIILVSLSACEDGQLFAPSQSAEGETRATASSSGEPRVEVQELQRPDLFNATENALWDGRPSLGGVWVAHPDVVDPERARIENTDTGEVVTGALFRRERQNPGPRIQVSSDAAAALGMLAGQPTELSVVVLRQEEVVIEPLPVDDEDVGTEDVTEPAMVDDSGAETAMVDEEADSAPKRKGFWASLREGFRRQPAEDPIQTFEIEGTGETAGSASAPEVETATLDPVTTAAAAAIDAAESEAAPARPTQSAAPASLKNPFIQVGLFSVRANADSAAASLRQAGIVPSIVEGSNGQTPFWRVLIGPMTTAGDQSTMLSQVRDLGYKDAFLTPK